MGIPLIKLDINPRLLNPGLEKQFTDEWSKITTEVAKKEVDRLKRESPEGVTGGLRSGYVLVAPRQGTLKPVGIRNSKPFSYFRAVGRGPGKRPPVGKLRRWAAAKGRNPYTVAKTIGEKGTIAWQTGRNVLGVEPKQSTPDILAFRSSAPWPAAVEEMARRMNQVRIP